MSSGTQVNETVNETVEIEIEWYKAIPSYNCYVSMICKYNFC